MDALLNFADVDPSLLTLARGVPSDPEWLSDLDSGLDDVGESVKEQRRG